MRCWSRVAALPHDPHPLPPHRTPASAHRRSCTTSPPACSTPPRSCRCRTARPQRQASCPSECVGGQAPAGPPAPAPSQPLIPTNPHALLPGPPPPLHRCRVMEAASSMEEYKEALLYGNTALGLTGSILVVRCAGGHKAAGLLAAGRAARAHAWGRPWLALHAPHAVLRCRLPSRHPPAGRLARGAVVWHRLHEAQRQRVLRQGAPLLRGEWVGGWVELHPSQRCTCCRTCCLHLASPSVAQSPDAPSAPPRAAHQLRPEPPAE